MLAQPRTNRPPAAQQALVQPELPEVGDAGLSMVEIVVAMVLLALLASFTATATVSVSAAARLNDARIQAAGLMTTEIDDAKATSPAALTSSETTKTVGQRQFTVKRVVSPYVNPNIDGGCAAAGAITAAFVRVVVTVSWPGGVPVQATTDIRTSGAAAGIPAGKGTIFSYIIDHVGKPVAGARVTLQPSGKTVLTGADGCAGFAGVDGSPTGVPYTMTVRKNGFVSELGKATATRTVTVRSGEVTNVGATRYAKGVTAQLRPSRDGVTPFNAIFADESQLIVQTPGLPYPEVVPVCWKTTEPGDMCHTSYVGELRNFYPGQYHIATSQCGTVTANNRHATTVTLTGDPNQVVLVKALQADLAVLFPQAYEKLYAKPGLVLGCLGEARSPMVIPVQGRWSMTVALPYDADDESAFFLQGEGLRIGAPILFALGVTWMPGAV